MAETWDSISASAGQFFICHLLQPVVGAKFNSTQPASAGLS